VLTKFAARSRLQTVADIKEEAPEWGWVDEYGDEILKLLQPIDQAWHKENEKKKAENKAKHARVTEENRVRRYEERLASARQETARRRAAAASSHRPVLEAVCPLPQQVYYPTPAFGVQYPLTYPFHYAAAAQVPHHPYLGVPYPQYLSYLLYQHVP
jgi:hypothetical protein